MSALARPARPAGCLSDFQLDRLMANDLVGDPTAEMARAHLATCARCKDRLAGFEAVRAPPFEALFAQSIKRKPRLRGKWWAVSAMGMAATAALVVGARLKRDEEPHAETRAKGVLAMGLVVRRPSGEVSRLSQGEIVFPGDALRFEVTSARAGFVTIVGLDASGAVTVYAPTGESVIHLEAGVPTVLPGSIVADSTLGPERIVALLCGKPPPLDDLRGAAMRALSGAGGDPRRVAEFGAPCSEASFAIEKRQPPGRSTPRSLASDRDAP